MKNYIIVGAVFIILYLWSKVRKQSKQTRDKAKRK